MAVANYHDEHGTYPPAYLLGPDGTPWHSWRVLILPYIEQQELYDSYSFDEPWDGPNNRKLADRMPWMYAFHSIDRDAINTTSNYLAVVGDNTVWCSRASVKQDDVTDSMETSILFVENQGANVHWMEPRDLDFATMDMRINSPRGISSPYDFPAVATVDGGLLRLSPSLDPNVLRAMFTINGGESLKQNEEGTWTLLADGRDRPLRDSGH